MSITVTLSSPDGLYMVPHISEETVVVQMAEKETVMPDLLHWHITHIPQGNDVTTKTTTLYNAFAGRYVTYSPYRLGDASSCKVYMTDQQSEATHFQIGPVPIDNQYPIVVVDQNGLYLARDPEVTPTVVCISKDASVNNEKWIITPA